MGRNMHGQRPYVPSEALARNRGCDHDALYSTTWFGLIFDRLLIRPAALSADLRFLCRILPQAADILEDFCSSVEVFRILR